MTTTSSKDTILPETTKETRETRSVEEALLGRLHELSSFKEKIEKYRFDAPLRRRAGYAALHAAREAAEAFYQQRHPGVHDVVPGLEGPVSFLKSELAVRKLIAQIIDDAVDLDPLKELTALLEAGDDFYDRGLAAAQACVALLGLGEYGGVFGAWQLQTLAFDILSWEEHVKFNERILADAQRLDPDSTATAATQYRLPLPAYLEAGCLGNIAKAGYRAVAQHTTAIMTTAREAVAARTVADEAMGYIEQDYDESTRATLLWPTMLAMRAAAAESLGDPSAVVEFWRGYSPEQAQQLLRQLALIEPCEQLVELVKTSARNHLK